ncbi:MAG: hypothetical protein PHF86_14070 [Candidatus Nanoarchaeia archaeon]|jgi:hypothetical protein|nr:hypothetical protein [Candidatus Nanoarchaeia archaeon]
MNEIVNFYHDIDIFGRESKPGTALEYFNADAIANALTLFLTTKKGDLLRNPNEGGVIDVAMFKTLNDGNIQKIGFQLKNAINNYFAPLIELQAINLIPDYENHLLQYDITFKDLTTFTTNTVTIYTNTSYQYQKFNFTEVAYIELNLLRFIQLQKTGDNSQKLLYNSDDGYWYFGKFKLINFTTTDPYFDAILSAANL